MQKCSQDIKQQPEPEGSFFIKYNENQADNNKRIKPDHIQIPSHLLMICKKIEKYHQCWPGLRR